MKRTSRAVVAVGFLGAVTLGLIAGAVIAKRQLQALHEAQMSERQAAWENEIARLQTALESAKPANRAVPPQLIVEQAGTPRLTPTQIFAQLQALQHSGKHSKRNCRQAVYLLEELALAGPEALPEIREFLARYIDVELDTSLFQTRSGREGLPLDFLIPPSVRFGLFDVLKQIGGTEAEKILEEALSRTGRGVEVAYLSRLLQQIAPGKYNHQSLTVARSLLASNLPLNSTSVLDRNHRDYLYGVLSALGDSEFVSTAQHQLVRADSQLDRSALNYLQQALGAQSVPIAAEAYRNPLLTNSAGKEPLARLALHFAGADLQANEFYQKAINDPILTRSHRQNLIEDLNETGFADPKNLTSQDLPLIESRISLIQQLSPNPLDEANAAGFKEAYKDLVNMRARVLRQLAVRQPETGAP
jgi:hypothetical protein